MDRGSLSTYSIPLGNAKDIASDSKNNAPSIRRPDSNKIGRGSATGHSIEHH